MTEVELHLGDCLDVLREMEPGSVDAVITDPPYSSGGQFRGDRMGNTEAKYKGFSKNADGWKTQSAYPEFTGDNRDQRGYLYWCALWLGQCQRVLRSGGLIFMFTDWRQLPTTTDAMQSGGLVWRGVAVWDKTIGRPIKGRFRNHLEFICWGTNGAMIEINDVYPSSVISVAPPPLSDRKHRTEKPVELITRLLEMATIQGTILDPFMGSGTTGVACAQTGRNFIGVEIDEGYFNIAKRRIAHAQAQPPLIPHEATPQPVQNGLLEDAVLP